MTSVRAVLAYAALSVATCAHAGDGGAITPALARRIDAAVAQVLEHDGAPSASIAIVRDGRVAYAAAYGQASIAPPMRATPRTRYQLASLSKTLTADAVLLLEQEGALSLDDVVARWIPDITGGDRITLRELLTHTAGYPDHYPQTYPAGPRTQPVTPDAIIGEWGRHPLLFEPGTRFRYSNLNYVIAARIAEKASGMPLFALLQDRILAPLGMSGAIDLDDVGPGTPDIATGYVRAALGSLRPAPNEGRGWSFGAGQVVATATDLARWDAGLIRGELLAPRQANEQVSTPTLADGSRSSYALGLQVATTAGRTVLSHVGQGLGFLAVNRIYPAERIAIVVLTNDSSSAAYAHIAQRIAYLVVPPTPAEAETRETFDAIRRNALDRSRATPDFNAYFDRRLATAYARSLAPLGEPESFELRSEDTADGLTTRVYDVGAGGRRMRVIEQRLPNGQLESFQVNPAD